MPQHQPCCVCNRAAEGGQQMVNAPQHTGREEVQHCVPSVLRNAASLDVGSLQVQLTQLGVEREPLAGLAFHKRPGPLELNAERLHRAEQGCAGSDSDNVVTGCWGLQLPRRAGYLRKM